MNDNVVVDSSGASESERNTLLIAYVLFCATFLGGVTAIAGFILSHIKAGEVSNEFIRSHYRWLIRTFWFCVLWWVISGALIATWILSPIGALGVAATFIWHIYRLIRGLLKLSERRPMPV
jgi:uncharacterized membrane protein